MLFSELVKKLGDAVSSHSLILNAEIDPEISAITAIDEAKPDTISYIDGKKQAFQVVKTAASALILPEDENIKAQVAARGIAWISGANPRLLFAKTIRIFYQPFRLSPAIHPTAIIDPTAEIGKDVAIGARVVIQARVKIGNQVCIHPNVVIYPEVNIGDRSLLHANCTIHERTKIGGDCVIHSGAVIGAEGFGFVPTRQGWYKMQQSGYTILEDGVEIGCNSTVDRPAVGETRIAKNTKLDNQVHIAHNCTIGSNCVLAGQVGLAGGVTVGNDVMLAGQVGIANRANINNGVIVTARSGIHNEIQAGEIVSGLPAISQKLFLKAAVIFSRLPEMYQNLKKLSTK